jgi:hypothetical protein
LMVLARSSKTQTHHLRYAGSFGEKAVDIHSVVQG